MKFSVTQMKMAQRDAIIIMTNYLIMSRQVNLGNNDIKKINISIKARRKREMKRVVVLQWLLETP